VPNYPVVPGSARILIVDDEPSICGALVQVLRRAGFDPIVAPSAIEADALLSESIAGMLVDLRMPHMRGDVFYFLAVARFPALRSRTIFMTGDISPDAERMINQTGCPCLWKPFPNAVLVDAVRTMLGDPRPTAERSAQRVN
jgi:two-component system C4-dicarboxylate transport response regulator DctD